MKVAVREYSRPFRQALQTAYGNWPVRQGLIVRWLDTTGATHFGEIAPIPWFGTESLAAARAWCDRLLAAPAQAPIPDNLPACQFGLAELPVSWQPMPTSLSPVNLCALLPAGEAALTAWPVLWEKGHRTFKWKIGMAAIADELSTFHALLTALPTKARVRLDANGGLTAETATQWLRACDAAGDRVEFLEQPLPPATILTWLQSQAGTFCTPIALDESVATLSQLRRVYAQVGDRVLYVLKPAIAGNPLAVYHFCTQTRLDGVISSALETPIGRDRVLALAQTLWAAGLCRRALGFGVAHWFADNWDSLTAEELWQQL